VCVRYVDELTSTTRTTKTLLQEVESVEDSTRALMDLDFDASDAALQNVRTGDPTENTESQNATINSGAQAAATRTSPTSRTTRTTPAVRRLMENISRSNVGRSNLPDLGLSGLEETLRDITNLSGLEETLRDINDISLSPLDDDVISENDIPVVTVDLREGEGDNSNDESSLSTSRVRSLVRQLREENESIDRLERSIGGMEADIREMERDMELLQSLDHTLTQTVGGMEVTSLDHTLTQTVGGMEVTAVEGETSDVTEENVNTGSVTGRLIAAIEGGQSDDTDESCVNPDQADEPETQSVSGSRLGARERPENTDL